MNGTRLEREGERSHSGEGEKWLFVSVSVWGWGFAESYPVFLIPNVLFFCRGWSSLMKNSTPCAWPGLWITVSTPSGLGDEIGAPERMGGRLAGAGAESGGGWSHLP